MVDGHFSVKDPYTRMHLSYIVLEANNPFMEMSFLKCIFYVHGLWTHILINDMEFETGSCVPGPV